MFIFLLVFLSASDFIWSAQWEHHIELHQEVRSFSNDESYLTRDNSYSIKIHNRSQWEYQRWSANFNNLLRRDPSKHRDSYLLQELWIRKEFDNLSLTIGSQIHDWTALEAFHPADVINARNLDSNFERPEKIGEWMFNLEIPNDEAVWNFYYMPYLQTQKFPKVNSRLLINNKPILFKRIMDHSGNFIASKTVEQFGIRFEKSLDELDFSFHYINHYDRQHPVIFSQLSNAGIFLGLPKVEQYGGTLTQISDDHTLKLECAYRNYDLELDSILPIINRPHSHFAIAVGFELPRQLNHGAELNYLLEVQTILGPNRLNRTQLNIFQRDLLIGARFARNDIYGTELLVSAIVDLERSTEILGQINFSRRINDNKKYELGLRFIEAKSTSIDDISGLKPFDGDLQITGSLIHYF